MIGKTISHCRIMERLGGDMGEVYMAGEPRLDRFVASKAGNKDNIGTTEEER
jgi:hypothetical protein